MFILKRIIFFVFILTLASCMDQQKSVIGKDVGDLMGGISESAFLSDRRAHFSRMPNRALCELALVVESEVYENTNIVPQIPSPVAERSPFSFGLTDILGSPNLEEVTLFPHNISVQNQPYSNRSLAMQELSSRAELERQKVCPILSDMNGQDAARAGQVAIPKTRRNSNMNKRDPACVDAANQLHANVLCKGTYDNKPFSELLADIIVLRQQAEASAAERRRLRSKMAPLVRCTSSELFGTISTTCY